MAQTAIPLTNAQRALVQSLEADALTTRAQFQQRLEDLGDMKRRFLLFVLQEAGITEGNYDLSDDGTNLVPGEIRGE